MAAQSVDCGLRVGHRHAFDGIAGQIFGRCERQAFAPNEDQRRIAQTDPGISIQCFCEFFETRSIRNNDCNRTAAFNLSEHLTDVAAESLFNFCAGVFFILGGQCLNHFDIAAACRDGDLGLCCAGKGQGGSGSDQCRCEQLHCL